MYTCDRIKTGDKGQRYEIRCCMNEQSVESAFGWTDVYEVAETMVESIKLHPCWHSPRIVDRHKKGDNHEMFLP